MKKLKYRKILVFIISIIVILCIGFVVIFNSNSHKEITFPYESNGLKIESVFEFTGMNVDNKETDGEDIASLQIQNTTKKYLKEATIKLTSEDDKVFEFKVQDIPSKKSVLVFDKKNNSSLNIEKYKDIEIETDYKNKTDLHQKDLKIDIDDDSRMEIINLTDDPLNDIVITYKCLMDDSYFGGISYTHKIKKLEAKQTVEYIDNYCLMGKAEITSVTIDD